MKHICVNTSLPDVQTAFFAVVLTEFILYTADISIVGKTETLARELCTQFPNTNACTWTQLPDHSSAPTNHTTSAAHQHSFRCHEREVGHFRAPTNDCPHWCHEPGPGVSRDVVRNVRVIRYHEWDGEHFGVQHCCEYEQTRARAVDHIGSSAQQQPKYSK